MPSTLERLGFSPTDRVVIAHADDLGMCHAANTAFADIVAAGVVGCGSVMVPCPWFRHLADFARSHPQADVGVHLTLTSEWEPYRWGPVSTRDAASGLLDKQGYLWPDIGPLHAHMDAEAAIVEMKAQVQQALEAGIDVTHIDTHMGAIAHPALIGAYVDLGREYRLPVMLPRVDAAALREVGLSPAEAEVAAAGMSALADAGDLLPVDHLLMPHMSPGEDIPAQYRRVLEGLQPGLTHLIYHPSVATDESRAILGEARLRQRSGDWRTFSDPDLAEYLADAGVVSIGYRELREVMREK